ncbi:MAG: zinc-ribbon domain-containing protein [bacterium]|nr:zinc-ribbon domain-containing protein [bacterium]
MDIMETIDKIGVTLTQTSKDIAKKAKDLVDVNTVKAAINDQKRVIAKAYERIGEQYYKDHVDAGIYEYEIEFETIGEANAKMKELYEQLHILKNVSVCPVCGASHSLDAAYCSKCGVKLNTEPVNTETPCEVKEEETEAAEEVKSEAEEVKSEETSQSDTEE